MTEPQEKIIVFRAYDTVVEANLAKTKLDAYGIPCFLTEENLTSLYPVRMGIFPGVRLHIFERDNDEVKSILDEGIETRKIICPSCNSDQYDQISVWRKMYFSFVQLLELTPASSAPKEFCCKKCGSYF